jgi:hypothetical protein
MVEPSRTGYLAGRRTPVSTRDLTDERRTLVAVRRQARSA